MLKFIIDPNSMLKSRYIEECINNMVVIWPFLKLFARNKVVWPFGHFWPFLNVDKNNIF